MKTKKDFFQHLTYRSREATRNWLKFLSMSAIILTSTACTQQPEPAWMSATNLKPKHGVCNSKASLKVMTKATIEGDVATMVLLTSSGVCGYTDLTGMITVLSIDETSPVTIWNKQKSEGTVELILHGVGKNNTDRIAYVVKEALEVNQ